MRSTAITVNITVRVANQLCRYFTSYAWVDSRLSLACQ